MPRFLPVKSRRGFTLIEMIVAVTVLMMLLLILVNLSGQAGKIWSHGERQNQYRQKARLALDFMGRELRQAVLARDGQKLQFLLANSASSGLDSKYRNHDALFWIAPVATDLTKGDLAEVGYFVQWDDTARQGNLCRFFVNPNDSNYRIYVASSGSSTWITDFIEDVAPATEMKNFKGLFLENVLGLWVKAYDSSGTNMGSDLALTSQLPAYVEVSLVFLDAANAKRMADTGLIAGVKNGAQSAPDAASFINGLPAPWLKNEAGLASVRVSLKNYK